MEETLLVSYNYNLETLEIFFIKQMKVREEAVMKNILIKNSSPPEGSDPENRPASMIMSLKQTLISYFSFK